MKTLPYSNCHINKSKKMRESILFIITVIFFFVESAFPYSYLSEMNNANIDKICNDPLSFYKRKAGKLKGFYPGWLEGKQVYWTVCGLKKGDNEVAFSEYGVVEDGFSIIPYIMVEGKLLNYTDFTVSQSLVNGRIPIPSVVWNSKKVRLDIEVLRIFGEKSLVRYAIKNISGKELNFGFYLNIKPFYIHPDWVYGGVSRIKKLRKDRECLVVNDKKKVIYLVGGGDIVLYNDIEVDEIENIDGIFNGNVLRLEDDRGMLSAMTRHKVFLRPGEKRNIYIMLEESGDNFSIAEKDVDGFYKDTKQKMTAYWELIKGNFNIELPNKKLEDTFWANVAYIYINGNKYGPCPGSRVYNKIWMRDGAVSCAALLRIGDADYIKNFLLWVSEYIGEDGFVPFMLDKDGNIPDYAKKWREYDSQGEYVYAVSEYYRFSRDKNFLNIVFPKVIKALKYLKGIRKKTLRDDYLLNGGIRRSYYGILPPSNSHEGYFPPRHSYWDDFWAVCAFENGIFLAREIGMWDDYRWLYEEKVELEKNLVKSVETTMKCKNIEYIPGSADLGDFDPNATAIVFFPANCYKLLKKKWLKDTFDKFYKEIVHRESENIYFSRSVYELRTAFPYMFFGDTEKMWHIINMNLKDLMPEEWREWCETILRNKRDRDYIGDMPHSWAGAIYVNLIRNIFVYEEDGYINLFTGIPDEWVKNKEKFGIYNARTWYGDVSCFVEYNKLGGIEVNIAGFAKPPKGFLLHVLGKTYKISKIPRKIRL